MTARNFDLCAYGVEGGTSVEGFPQKIKLLPSCLSSKPSLPWWHQLKERAPVLKQKYPSEDPLKESEWPACKQTKLDVFTKSCICSLEQSAVISNLKTQVIVKYPINLVNRKGFQQLIAYLEPGYCLPSDTHFTHLVEYKYVAVKVKVRELLEHQVNCLAILADM